MAMTQPQTTVYIYSGVPLDKGYKNTLSLKGKTPQDQRAAFDSYLIKTCTLLTYQRYDKGELKLEIPADEIYNANYMIFTNLSYGNRWFFAFVNKVEYVSDNVCRVRYTIDDVQTWWYDFDFANCYVEREHSATDDLGEWYVAEPFDKGDIIFEGDVDTVDFTPNSGIIVSSAWNLLDPTIAQPGTPTAKVINNSVTGLAYFRFESQQELADALTALSRDRMDWIEMAYLVPSWANNQSGYAYQETAITKNCPTSLDGYVPKNKKMLYNYPFAYVVGMDNAQQVKEYYYKLSGDAFSFRPKIKFSAFCMTQPSPQGIVYPINYENQTRALNESITFNNFPVVPYTGDYYQIWWRQNGASYIFDVLGNFANNLGKVAHGSALTSLAATPAAPIAVQGTYEAVSGFVNGALGIMSVGADIAKQANHANLVSGAENSVDLRVGMGYYKASFYTATCTYDYAKMVDEFLSMYGYQTNAVKKPNIKDPLVNIRPYWNYLKTKGATLVRVGGSSRGYPADAYDRLVNIFDNGITFWNSLENVGNYSLNNAPTI